MTTPTAPTPSDTTSAPTASPSGPSTGGALGLFGGVFGAITGELTSFAKSLKEENQTTIDRILPPKPSEPEPEPHPTPDPIPPEVSKPLDSTETTTSAADPKEAVVTKVTAGLSAVSGALSSFWAATAEKAASLIGPEEPSKPDLQKMVSSTSLGLSMKWEDEEDVPLGSPGAVAAEPEKKAGDSEEKKEGDEAKAKGSGGSGEAEGKAAAGGGEDWAAWN